MFSFKMQCQGDGTVHLNSRLDEVLTALALQNSHFKRLDVFSPKLSPGMVSFPCVTVMDAMGKEHQIPLDFCFSYDVCGLDRILRRGTNRCYFRRFLHPFSYVYPVPIIQPHIQKSC